MNKEIDDIMEPTCCYHGQSDENEDNIRNLHTKRLLKIK